MQRLTFAQDQEEEEYFSEHAPRAIVKDIKKLDLRFEKKKIKGKETYQPTVCSFKKLHPATKNLISRSKCKEKDRKLRHFLLRKLLRARVLSLQCPALYEEHEKKEKETGQLVLLCVNIPRKGIDQVKEWQMEWSPLGDLQAQLEHRNNFLVKKILADALEKNEAFQLKHNSQPQQHHHQILCLVQFLVTEESTDHFIFPIKTDKEALVDIRDEDEEEEQEKTHNEGEASTSEELLSQSFF